MGKTLLCDRFLEARQRASESLGAFVLRARAREERVGVHGSATRVAQRVSRRRPAWRRSSAALSPKCLFAVIPRLPIASPGSPNPRNGPPLQSAVSELLSCVARSSRSWIFVDDLAYADARAGS
jgi:hypothetical protein